MNTKTMEGLVGAGTNINMVNTPLRIFKEARRTGDIATMERAMGYVNEFESRAEQYKTQTDEGMKEDAKEARKKVEAEREKAIRERREEHEKMEERVEESREDRVEISENGKILLEENTDMDNISSEEAKADAVKEPMTYTKTGEVNRAGQLADVSICV